MIIEGNPRQAPFRELAVGVRQQRQDRPLDGLEQMPAADAEPAHDVGVDALHHGGDRGVRLGQREEGLPPKPSEDIALGEAYAGLDLRLVAGLARAGRKNADAVMGGHHPVAAIDLGMVERGSLDAGLQIVGHDEARHAAEEAEHPDMGLDPVSQRLRPAGLGIGVVRGPQHGDEDLGLAQDAGAPIDDRELLGR